MLHDVVEARHLRDYRVFLRFDDDSEGEVDLAGVVRFEGVFASLQAVERFAEVTVNPDLGTIAWPNGADIAPERLYDELRRQAPQPASPRP